MSAPDEIPAPIGAASAQRRSSHGKKGYRKEQLPLLPSLHPNGAVPLGIKFVAAGRSVAIFTRHSGPSPPWPGRAVETSTPSAAEISRVCVGGLATLVGITTPRQAVATSAFKVGFGYRIVIPVAAITREGQQL
jgi:hypothetical protein